MKHCIALGHVCSVVTIIYTPIINSICSLCVLYSQAFVYTDMYDQNRDAMRKERKDILDIEARRIREKQQMEAIQASKAAAAGKEVQKRKSNV